MHMFAHAFLLMRGRARAMQDLRLAYHENSFTNLSQEDKCVSIFGIDLQSDNEGFFPIPPC